MVLVVRVRLGDSFEVLLLLDGTAGLADGNTGESEEENSEDVENADASADVVVCGGANRAEDGKGREVKGNGADRAKGYWKMSVAYGLKCGTLDCFDGVPV